MLPIIIAPEGRGVQDGKQNFWDFFHLGVYIYENKGCRRGKRRAKERKTAGTAADRGRRKGFCKG